VVGARVSGPEIRAGLYGGSLRAAASLSLSEPDAAPFAVELEAAGTDAAQAGPVIGLQTGTITGTGAAKGTIEGRLSPERAFVQDADIDLHVSVRDGTLGNTPRTVTLARLASPLGWMGLFGRALPFDTVTLGVQIEGGRFHTDDFALDGPELRLLAAGEIDLLSEELETDMLVALLFFDTVDSVVEKVPVVGRWVLGKDRSLVAAYFRLHGPWDDPDGTYVPPGTLRTATGWAGKLLGGVKRIRDLLVGVPEQTETDGENDAGPGQGH
jgi:hypothetical protein